MRRIVSVLLIVGVSILLAIQWYERRLAAPGDESLVQVPLPAGFEPFVECADIIRPLHEKKKPVQPGDWLDRHSEGGQTFAQYVQHRRAKPLRDDYSTIYILPLGEFDETQMRIVGETAECMKHFFGVPTTLLDAIPLEEAPSDARRTRDDGIEQVLTQWIMNEQLKPRRPDDAVVLIGLVTCDLWPGDLNWVFGEASMFDRVGVWSLHRNGDPRASEASYRLCLRRTIKTAMHETGHMLGIPHCIHFECGMNGSRSREESDRQPVEFCPECQPKIWWTCGADATERSRQLSAFASQSGLLAEASLWKRQATALESHRAKQATHKPSTK